MTSAADLPQKTLAADLAEARGWVVVEGDRISVKTD